MSCYSLYYAKHTRRASALHAYFGGFFYGRNTMKYTKHPLTYEDQADLLISRNLIADRDLLISYLSTVNYYRFSGYLHPYRNQDGSFRSGTTLDMVWRHYTFDRRLRLIPVQKYKIFECEFTLNPKPKLQTPNPKPVFLHSRHKRSIRPRRLRNLLDLDPLILGVCLCNRAGAADNSGYSHFNQNHGDGYCRTAADDSFPAGCEFDCTGNTACEFVVGRDGLGF